VVKTAVTVQQQVDDIIAKLGSRTGVTDAQRKALTDAVTLAENRRSAEQKLLEVNVQADATQRKLGDGTLEYTTRMIELNKELATGRLSQQAYNQAAHDAQVTLQNQSDTAKRLADNFDSLGAGFDQAARSYAQAHDMYATGASAFNALTSAMDEGLDALAGTSTKTFAQIASDFALMLAKMAVQAAASQVFKALFATGSSIIPGAGIPGAAGMDAFLTTPGGGASGGLFSQLFGSLFGTGRAGGGSVDPGQIYRVGEYGPETFIPKVAGTIAPAGANAGGVTVNLDMSGGGQQGTTPAQALALGRKVKAAVADVIQTEKLPGGSLYSRVTA
jgi:hypothetical protein